MGVYIWWESHSLETIQFAVSVHNKKNISNAEKTVYLQHAIKDGDAKNAIEGLSHSGNNYEEAVECLKSRWS